ncbi:MAG TPA: GatB/YqeY domain-containing protein [Patescibacteria group bacterium]|nr:GatB/YqeY domain-containing protein [Patescibacteria group bacterium]
MSLYETIGNQLKEAMKSGETLKRDTLRLLISSVKNVAIEKRKPAAEFTDAETEDVIRRMVKQRKDSIVQYRAGNRMDLVEKEEVEVAILMAYLPQAMPEEELRALIDTALKEAGITAKSQIGQAMGVAMKQVAGRATGDDVRRIVEGFLS